MAWWSRGGSDPAPPRGDAATGTPSPTPPTSAADVQRSAWRDLPPLRPTLTPTSPIAPLDSFTSSLATAHNPSFLAPLGHLVDPDGPGGQVAGLASPVVPHPVAVHTELPVAPRPAKNAAAAVQRVLAGPRMWFSDNTSEAPGHAAPQVSAGSAQVEYADPAAAMPAYDLPRVTLNQSSSAEPLRDSPSRASHTPAGVVDPPRRLPAALPTVSRTVSYTAAPRPGERTVLPTVATPVTQPATVTVSRHASEDHQHDADDHQHDADDHQHDADDAHASDANDTVQTAQLLAASPSAPLIDHIVEPSPPSVSLHSNTSPHEDVPAAPELQRAIAEPASATTLSVARPDRSNPAAGSLAPSGTSTDSFTESAAAPEARIAPVVQPTLAGSSSIGTSVGSSVSSAATTDARRPSFPTTAPDTGQPVPARPTGLGAPLTSGGDPFGVIQRHAADPSPPAIGIRSAVPGRQYPTRGDGSDAGISPLPARSETSYSTTDSANGTASADFQPAADLAMVLPPPELQRAVVDRQSASGQPPADLPLAAAAGETDLAGDLVSTAEFAAPPTIAPLLGSTGGSPSAETGEPQDRSTGPTGSVAGSGALDPATSSRPAAEAGLISTSGAVQRSLATSAPTIGSSSPVPSASASAAAPAGGTERRLGVGAPIPADSSDAVASSGDRVTVREMSLQRMFEPAAAAIASGAAYADGPGSVVFRPPAPPPASASPTVPMVPMVPTVPMVPLDVARVVAPRIGSTLGLGPPVQRFGIPDASSLLGKARDTASSAVSSARGTVGSYADTARQSVGGYADAAQQAAGGYADQARGYADTARGTLGSYADTARQTAGGYLDSARGAASGYADQAGGYVDQARGLAGGAADTLGGYGDSARSAAGGYFASAQQAAGGLADSAGSAVQQATSAAGGAVDQVTEAAGGLASDASQAAAGAGSAISGAVGAVTGAAAGAAGAAGALPTDLDELARRLFDPLSARIRSELLLDRERAGMITDLRR